MNLNIKMIVTDLDQTLLRTDKALSASTVETIKKARARGIKFVVATGRPKRSVLPLTELLPCDGLILHNGALLCIGDETLIHNGIEAKSARDFLLSISSDTQVCVEIDEVLYANFDVSASWRNTGAVITDFTDLPDTPVDKILIPIKEVHEIEHFHSLLSDDMYIQSSEGRIALIMSKEATKAKGLKILLKHFGSVSLTDVAAFGDDYNDIEMITEVGYGVAVKNALDEVKSAAAYICPSNDEDGVAQWINQNILN
jgi:Cof subfamily protein (haloacid dehalogenase superfamily)